MSAGNNEKAADGGLENSDETEAPSDTSKDATESPGAMSSEKDIESQEPRVTQEGKKEESFRFAASVSSIWIPSVVGDQKQKFFLKAGEDKTCSGFSSSNEIFQE